MMTPTCRHLSNGLTVLCYPNPAVETVALGLWTGVGARQETAEHQGVAHFLEHMLFKGTKTRSARDIAHQIEAVGGHLNAYTGREVTGYYARVLGDDAPLALDILSDMVQHAALAPDEFEREREVILQEIAQAMDMPDDVVFDHMQAAAFADQSLGRPILGTRETVGAMTPKAVRHFLTAHYRGEHMILAASGAIDAERLTALAEQTLASLPGNPPRATPSRPNTKKPAPASSLPPSSLPPSARLPIIPSSPAARWIGGEKREKRPIEQLHLVMSFAGVSATSADYYGAVVMAIILGGGMSSRLFQEVREKRGLAYSIGAHYSGWSDAGMMTVHTSTQAGHVNEMIAVLCDEIAALASTVRHDELAAAKNQCKASLLMALESTLGQCEHMTRSLFRFGEIIPPATIAKRIDTVSVADVQRLAAEITRHPPALAAVGPTDSLESYSAVCARLN
ncbi:MAG: pitrilysin family protein [Pseudomonadota bacterium]